MKILVVVAGLVLGVAVQAQQPALPPGTSLWTKGIPPEGMQHKSDYGTYILSVSHREKDGVVELHEKKDDVMIVQSGEGDLVVGGKGLDMRTSAPGEQQGTSIEGGTRVHVRSGDVIRIPAGTPHQYFVAPGQQITYSLVKVLER